MSGEPGNAPARRVSIARSQVLAPVVVLVDGLTRSGKSLLGPVLSSFERVEIERLEPDIEWIGDMYHIGKIEPDAAVGLVGLCVHRFFYEGLIGRNSNFRFGDHSSVWQAPKRFQYFRRLFVDERLPLKERVDRERPIFQTMVHHQLMNLRLYLRAFGERLRLVEMIRDPVDLADSWMRKRKGELIGNDPLISMVSIQWEGRTLPWYVAGREIEYLASSPTDRVLIMIAEKWRLSLAAYRSFTSDERKQVCMIPLEDFVSNPEPYLKKLGGFIGTGPTGSTEWALKAQRCPRVYDRSAHTVALDRIRKQASPKWATALEQMTQQHANLVREIRL
jgi:hypothetical protein